MVGNFGDGADGASGGADGVPLAECDSRGDSVDPINAGSIHSFEKLAGVGAERFRITALAFSVEGVES